MWWLWLSDHVVKDLLLAPCSLLSFSWNTCSGEASWHVVRMVKQPYGEVQVAISANSLLQSLHPMPREVNHFGSKSYNPDKSLIKFRWMQPEPTLNAAWLQPQERTQTTATQLSCSCIPNPQTLWIKLSAVLGSFLMQQ